MSAPISNKEMIESLTKEEIFNLWIMECDKNKMLWNANFTLKQKLKDAEEEAEKYMRWWRRELKERDGKQS